jgi:hypothetical protein
VGTHGRRCPTHRIGYGSRVERIPRGQEPRRAERGRVLEPPRGCHWLVQAEEVTPAGCVSKAIGLCVDDYRAWVVALDRQDHRRPVFGKGGKKQQHPPDCPGRQSGHC